MTDYLTREPGGGTDPINATKTNCCPSCGEPLSKPAPGEVVACDSCDWDEYKQKCPVCRGHYEEEDWNDDHGMCDACASEKELAS